MHNSLLFLTVFLGVMTAMAPLSTDMYLPSLPEIGGSFSISTSMVQLTLTMTMVGMSLGQILGGRCRIGWGARSRSSSAW